MVCTRFLDDVRVVLLQTIQPWYLAASKGMIEWQLYLMQDSTSFCFVLRAHTRGTIIASCRSASINSRLQGTLMLTMAY